MEHDGFSRSREKVRPGISTINEKHPSQTVPGFVNRFVPRVDILRSCGVSVLPSPERVSTVGCLSCMRLVYSLRRDVFGSGGQVMIR